MRSSLKTVPLIGALLLSASPAQASKTFKEIIQPCKASEEMTNACDAMAIHFSAEAIFYNYCGVEHETKVTPELLKEKPQLHAKTKSGAEAAKIAYNSAIKKVKSRYPNCSVKYIP